MTRIPIDDGSEPKSDEELVTEAQDQASDSNEVLKLRTERDQLFERLARAQAEAIGDGI
jgi:hypothetical protein